MDQNSLHGRQPYRRLRGPAALFEARAWPTRRLQVALGRRASGGRAASCSWEVLRPDQHPLRPCAPVSMSRPVAADPSPRPRRCARRRSFLTCPDWSFWTRPGLVASSRPTPAPTTQGGAWPSWAVHRIFDLTGMDRHLEFVEVDAVDQWRLSVSQDRPRDSHHPPPGTCHSDRKVSTQGRLARDLVGASRHPPSGSPSHRSSRTKRTRTEDQSNPGRSFAQSHILTYRCSSRQ